MRDLSRIEVASVSGGNAELAKEDWRLISGVGIGLTGGAFLTTAALNLFMEGFEISPIAYAVELALLGASLAVHFTVVEEL